MSATAHARQALQRRTLPHTSSRRQSRMTAVGGAVGAALAVWVLAEGALGIDLQQPAFETAQKTQDIGPALVAVTSAFGALAGWALLAGLERLTARARGAWTAIAVLTLVGSLGAPLSGTGISDENRLMLVLMHVAVAAVVIPALYRTSPSRTRRPVA